MKKALKSKFSGPTKLVRKVLSKSSNASHERESEVQEVLMTEEIILSKEIESLQHQISNLKAAINALQEDTEKKEMAIAKLARENEKLNLDLLKQKRSNNSLTKQLEDEREFYFKEKEMYCQEMNECKKIKRLMSNSSMGEDSKYATEYKSEILKLKQTLNHTLEANYNLSIKFLRMKNTKTCLKTELKTMKLEHEKLESDYKSKIENLTSELNGLVNEKLNATISPSSKKYLQLVKQNSCLVYENLCLQLEIDNLNLKFQKLKLEQTKSDTNSRLKYIHHSLHSSHDERSERKKLNRDHKKVRIQDEEPEKLEKEPLQAGSSGMQSMKDNKIVKIYERKESLGVPEIRILNEKGFKTNVKGTKKRSHSHKKKEEATQHENNLNKFNGTKENNTTVLADYQIKIDENCREKLLNIDRSKLGLFQVSDMASTVTSSISVTPSMLMRSRSSPDIVFATSFHKKNDK